MAPMRKAYQQSTFVLGTIEAAGADHDHDKSPMLAL